MQQLIKVSHSSMLLYQEFLMKYTLYIEICRQNILNNIFLKKGGGGQYFSHLKFNFSANGICCQYF